MVHRVHRYTQPPESLGAITTIPYTAEIPSSSQCTTYTSAQLWTNLAPAASVSRLSASFFCSSVSSADKLVFPSLQSESSTVASDASTAVSSGATSGTTGVSSAGTTTGGSSTRAAGANNAQNTASPTGAASVGRQPVALAALVGVAGFAALAVLA